MHLDTPPPEPSHVLEPLAGDELNAVVREFARMVPGGHVLPRAYRCFKCSEKFVEYLTTDGHKVIWYYGTANRHQRKGNQ